MPRTRRMRADESKLSDGWSYEQTARFVNLLYHECKAIDLNNLDLLTGALQRISADLSALYGRRFSLYGVKKKLENLRNRNESFKQFMETPGVCYNAWDCETRVNNAYWNFIPAAEESEWFRNFRMNGEPLHLKLEYIFDHKGVGVFPKDLTGSPGWPIHVRDSDDDELAVVPVGTSGELTAIPFDIHNEVVVAERGRDEAGPSGHAEGGGSNDGGLSGNDLWMVD